ncbi:vWA domain-containing protein [uncultured Arcticibacterium sp.]|mgnify:CR=1 FL=1|uniref:vWA domain-containing protein n=1 Tax=uncultured Arcticibacterium sp. TaxID=2173042 RepID=UPI0030FA8234
MKLFNNSAFLRLAVLAMSFSLFSCGGGNDPNPKGSTFEIYLDFWNTSGRTPEVRFDELNTSREIKIDFSKTFQGTAEGSSFTKVEIDNFRIIDQNSNNYNIEDITAYELRDGVWKKDIEFTMDFDQSEDISVVLVLDRSESLGADFSTIKSYANDFIDQVFDDREVVKMGVVDFADDVKSHPLTTQREELKSYVNSLVQGKFTTLYDAVDIGIDILQDSDSQSKVLFVFTDGSDNNSSPNVNVDYLLNRIKSDKNDYKITSFAIGLDGDGGVDQNILTKLSGNGGTASFPKTIGEAKGVFEKFSRVISNVYSLEYLRNQQVIPRNSPAKLKFEITTIK